MRTIFLIGMMGTGKTTVGKVLSERLGLAFFDTDIAVETNAGMSVRELFLAEGEAAFRLLEQSILHSVPVENAVVATGGGIVLDADNRLWIQAKGDIVWLMAADETLRKRLAADGGRPLLQGDIGEKLVALRKSRTALYDKISAYAVNVDDKSPDEISCEIIRLLGLAKHD